MTAPTPASGASHADQGEVVTRHDCGHTCCDDRRDPFHDHFLAADNCPSCVSGTP